MEDHSSDTDTESSSGSDFTYLMPGAAENGAEKLTKVEMAEMYAQQMNTMVTHYESFINEMQELSLRPVTGMMKKRGVKAPTSGGAQAARVESGNNNINGGRKGIISDRLTNTSGRPTSPTSSCNSSKPCCSKNDFLVLNKKVDAICSFVQMIFSSQVNLLGKCYQDQMEMRQRVDELRAMTEEYDEEFEHLEKEVIVLKKGINDIKVFTSKSVDKKTKIIMEELKQFVSGINERTGNVGKRVDELIQILHRLQQTRNFTLPNPASASKVEKDAEEAPKATSSQPAMDVADDVGLD